MEVRPELCGYYVQPVPGVVSLSDLLLLIHVVCDMGCSGVGESEMFVSMQTTWSNL